VTTAGQIPKISKGVGNGGFKAPNPYRRRNQQPVQVQQYDESEDQLYSVSRSIGRRPDEINFLINAGVPLSVLRQR
jgi:hypothetical protein